LFLATTLSLTAPNDQAALVFAAVFVIVWVGAFFVTINALLLGGNMYATPHCSAVLTSHLSYPVLLGVFC